MLRVFYTLLLSIFIFFLALYSVSVGYIKMSFFDALNALWSQGPGHEVAWLRLREAVVAVVAGVVLGAGGAVMQASLRNPLASPFTLGIPQAAALGAAFAMMSGSGVIRGGLFSVNNPYVVSLYAVAFAILQLALVIFLAYRAGLDARALVLAAIAMSFFYQAMLALIQYLYLNELQIAAITFYLFGDLSRADDLAMYLMAFTAAAVAVVVTARHVDLDLLSLGDDVASASGISPKRARVFLAAVVTIGAAVVTAFVGVLAFLCLVSPHIARYFVGASHKYLLPASMATGAALLLASDIVARTVLSPVVLPVGIVLSFLGTSVLIARLIWGVRHA